MTQTMKVIYNKLLPFPGYFAINLFGYMFIRDVYKDRKISKQTFNHELTHTEQAFDFVFKCEKLQILGYLIFYIIYFMEWLIKLLFALFTLGKVKAYRSISFEQEAYNNQGNLKYLNSRKPFAWTKYIFKVVWK